MPVDSDFIFCPPEKRRGQMATLSIAAMVILVGVPLWWRTTETYRAWLPVGQIKDLADLQVSASVCYLHVLCVVFAPL